MREGRSFAVAPRDGVALSPGQLCKQPCPTGLPPQFATRRGGARLLPSRGLRISGQCQDAPSSDPQIRLRPPRRQSPLIHGYHLPSPLLLVLVLVLVPRPRRSVSALRAPRSVFHVPSSLLAKLRQSINLPPDDQATSRGYPGPFGPVRRRWPQQRESRGRFCFEFRRPKLQFPDSAAPLRSLL
jgi:hypothetical protein